MAINTKKKLLIANRGEIAERIALTCRSMGIKTFALTAFGEGHKGSLVDHWIELNGNSLQETFLNIKQIKKIIDENAIGLVHPGFGFLAENTAFAKMVEGSNAIWIGPNSKCIDQMGSKIKAKKLAESCGVSVLPWMLFNPSEKIDEKKLSMEIGYPLIIKASGGGGGKGMRIVYDKKDLKTSLQLCMQEAKNNFGDGSVFIEKYVEKPRHLEIQILGKNNGEVLHFYSRECSVQRRYQKIIEEAPAVNVPAAVLDQMTSDAISISKKMKYVNAGTFEFIYDGSHVYFLEMNTRLQVEHPVTENITGVDLVKWQILTALKENRLSQEDIQLKGHSIEVRIYAEDPLSDFLPATGDITHYDYDKSNYLRVDSHIYQGYSLLPYFDPMIGKFIIKGDDRTGCITQLVKSLKSLKLLGIKHNVKLLVDLLTTYEFIENTIYTSWVEKEYMTKWLQQKMEPQKVMQIFSHLYEEEQEIFTGKLERMSLFQRLKV